MTSLATFGWLQLGMIADEAALERDQKGRLQTQRLLTNLMDAQRGVHAYALTHQEEFLDAYHNAVFEIPLAYSALQELVQAPPQQREGLHEVWRSTQQSLLTLESTLTDARARGIDANVSGEIDVKLKDSDDIVTQTIQKIEQFAAQEKQIFSQHKRKLVFRQIASLTLVFGFVVIGTGGTVLAARLFFNLDRELADREVSLRQLNQKLQLTNEQLQRFTANASHELRTPLAAVLSNAQVGLLASMDDTTQPRRRLEKIVDLTKSMSSLVGNLLALARYDEILAPETLTQTDLVELLQQMAQDYAERAPEHRLQFTSQVPTYSLCVAAEPELLRQAIVNLLENAYRYTPPEGWVQLRLVAQVNSALIQVEDSGIGIPEESLSRIFEQFYRVEQTTRKHHNSFGLGLALTQQIVRIHGGEIRVTSTLGQGSLFEIQLPRSVCP